MRLARRSGRPKQSPGPRPASAAPSLPGSASPPYLCDYVTVCAYNYVCIYIYIYIYIYIHIHIHTSYYIALYVGRVWCIWRVRASRPLDVIYL